MISYVTAYKYFSEGLKPFLILSARSAKTSFCNKYNKITERQGVGSVKLSSITSY